MTQVCVLGAVLSLGGCYLSHERAAEAVSRDAGAPDARIPETDARVGDPPTPRPDASVECEPRPPVAPRGPEGDCTGPAPPGGTTRALLGPHVGVSVATDGCDVWAVSGSPGVLWRLGREGIWREVAETGVSGLRSHLVVGGEGALHLVVEATDSLYHSIYRPGDGFGPVRVIAETGRPRLLVPEPLVHRVTAPLGDRIPLVYRTDDPMAIWITDLATGDEPRALAGPTDGVLSMPRICRAGAERLVVAWSDGGRATAAVSDDAGESFRTAPIGLAADEAGGATLVDVDCASDGRALAVWLRDDEAHTAWLDREGCWHGGDRLPAEGGAFYPHVWIGPEGALLTWRIRAGMTYATAVIDHDGRVRPGPVTGPDVNGDGQGDRHLHSCALPGGYAVMAQGERSVEGGAGTAHLSILSPEGELDRAITLGLFGAAGLDLGMVCDRHGRVGTVYVDGQAIGQSWTPSI